MPRTSFNQGHSRTLHCHIGSGAHRYSHLSLSQRRSVVDTIAGHRHESASSLKLLHYVHVLIRKNFRHHFVDVQLPGNGVCGGATVTS